MPGSNIQLKCANSHTKKSQNKTFEIIMQIQSNLLHLFRFDFYLMLDNKRFAFW